MRMNVRAPTRDEVCNGAAEARAEAINDAAKVLSNNTDLQKQLRSGLEKIVVTIEHALREEDYSPRRAGVRDKLEDLRRAAKQVAGLMNDPDLAWLRSQSLDYG